MAKTSSSQISIAGALAIGFASILGAGVFGVFREVAGQVGNWLLLPVLLAGLVAAINAASIYQLASANDRAGGVYSYARKYRGPGVAYLAGISFVVGKIGSIAAIGLVFGEYLSYEFRTPLAAIAIALLTAINLVGISRTALVAAVLATITVTFLLLSSLAGLFHQSTVIIPDSGLFSDSAPSGYSILQASALMFFAFAGYARVATLGSEVKHPRRNIPRAILITLVSVTVLYLLSALALQRMLGDSLATAPAPFQEMSGIVLPWLPGWVTPVVVSLACLGSMLALLAGVSRTAATMAEDGELSRALSVRNKFGAPWAAEVLIAFTAIALTSLQDLSWIIGFSSIAVLLYYAIGHFTALAQPATEKTLPSWIAALGLILCLVLAVAVPWGALLASTLLLALAVGIRRMRRLN